MIYEIYSDKGFGRPGLGCNSARFFTDAGRFTQIDPMWQEYPSISPYVRVANNPLRLVDEDGEEPISYLILIYKYQTNYLISQVIKNQVSLLAVEIHNEYGGIHNGPADAWRHAEWSKISSEAIGQAWTLTFGLGHELDNIWNKNSNMSWKQLFLEVEMDITNNKIGRNLAGTNTKVEDLISGEKLETIEPENDQDYLQSTNNQSLSNEKPIGDWKNLWNAWWGY